MNRDAASGQSRQTLPDNASLFHVHETVSATRASFALNTSAEGFTIGASYDPDSLFVEWANLEAIGAFPIASRCRVAYRHVGGITCREYKLRSLKGSQHFQTQTERLFAHIEEHRPLRAFRGWLDVPRVSWLDANAWPSLVGVEDAGYRENARADKLLCEARDATTSFDRFVLFLQYGRLGYGNHLGDFALSPSLLYRRYEGRIQTLPRASLRLRRQSVKVNTSDTPYSVWYEDGFTHFRTPGGDWLCQANGSITKEVEPRSLQAGEPNLALYTFGRDLDVFLYNPETNPVALELDKQLLASRDAAVAEHERDYTHAAEGERV